MFRRGTSYRERLEITTIEQMRLSATKSLLERKDTVIVRRCPASNGSGNPVDYHGMILHVARKERMPPSATYARLAAMPYERNELEFKPAPPACGGMSSDVFPAENSETALRIALLDDEVESLTLFDP